MSKKIFLVILLSVFVTMGVAMRSTSSTSSDAADPLHNPNGLKAGLAPVPKDELPRARVLIRKVKVADDGANRPYDRAAFGAPWTDDSRARLAHNGCKTRDDVLKRDMSRVAFRSESGDHPGCVVSSGRLSDPYTGETIDFSKSRAQTVQVDHVVSLHEAWLHGADPDHWSADRRETYANDPLVLVAVDGPTNIRKSDYGPSEWLPPNHDIWCALAVRRAQIEVRYRLTVTERDRNAMLSVCS
jgi:hypothetical protein